MKGARLTHLKITSGKLKVKDVLKGGGDASSCWEEKVNEIRIYSGEKYEQAQEIRAGTVCAVTGLSSTYPGEGLGIEKKSEAPALEPVLNYQVELPQGCDVHVMLKNFRQLEEEDPMLRVVWEEELGEIHVQLMGEVQTEVLKDVVSRRFGVEVTFGACGIVYKETIGKTAEGVGHFEPLRHYAEVHLILEPGKRGSGLVFESDVSEDVLDRNWQRLILAHLAEKTHRGVLIGAPLTDVKITLAAGRAHLKHTEGGDFREATYRAVRQGLMQAESILLEPYYEFQLEVPSEFIGRAITDIQRMAGEFGQPVTDGEMSEISGSVPVAAMRGYQREVAGYTKGQGRLSCIFKGYEVCQNAEEVIEQSGYDPELDSDNPAGSVFCDHGAGFYVPWNKVSEYMHIESQLKKRKREAPRKLSAASRQERGRKGRTGLEVSGDDSEDGELEEIFIRTYGRVERRRSPSRIVPSKAKRERKKEGEAVREYLLVDGYNIIYAWEELKALAEEHIEAARNKLVDILCNYQGFKKCSVILVFDAYRVEGCELEVQKYGGIYVVYTKEAETADQYIEKVVHQIGKKYQVAVATSDRTEQVITLGQGGRLISAQEFKEEIESAKRQIREACERRRESGKNYLFDHMDEKLAKEMEEVRLGQKKSLTGVSERRKR